MDRPVPGSTAGGQGLLRWIAWYRSGLPAVPCHGAPSWTVSTQSNLRSGKWRTQSFLFCLPTAPARASARMYCYRRHNLRPRIACLPHIGVTYSHFFPPCSGAGSIGRCKNGRGRLQHVTVSGAVTTPVCPDLVLVIQIGRASCRERV